MRNNKEIKQGEAYKGMHIKLKLPSKWCQIKTKKLFCWLKGYVKEVRTEKVVIVTIWSKEVGTIGNMMVIAIDGLFPGIVKQR